MPGPTRGALRLRKIQILEPDSNQGSRATKNSLILSHVRRAGAGSFHELSEAEAFQRRFGARDRGIHVPPMRRGSMPMEPKTSNQSPRTFFAGVTESLRGLYHRWSQGPRGMVLMGASFLLENPDSFQSDHPCDSKFSVGVMDVVPMAGAELRVTEGQLVLGNRQPRKKIWIQEGSELKELQAGDSTVLTAGVQFFTGEKPATLHRRGFDQDRTNAYRVEGIDPSGAWSIKKLAHGEEKLEDFQVYWVMDYLAVDSETVRRQLEPLLREIEGTGWTAEQKAFLKTHQLMNPKFFPLIGPKPEPFLKTGGMVNPEFFRPIDPKGDIYIELFNSLTELLRIFRENSWGPGESFPLIRALVGDGQGLKPVGFDAATIFQGFKEMREMGLSLEEIGAWTHQLIRNTADYEGMIEMFPSALRKIAAVGIESRQAASLLLEVFKELDDRDLPGDLVETLARLLRDADFETAQVLQLVQTMSAVLGDSSPPETQIQNYLAEIFPTPTKHLSWETPSKFSQFWAKPSIRSYLLNLTADFGSFLKKFQVPAETRAELITAMIAAYREEVPQTFIELMKPEYADFFADWETTFPELFEELNGYRYKGK